MSTTDFNYQRQSVVIVEQETMPDRRRVSSAELLGNHQELIIEHNHDEYRLRLTSNNKLILTK